VQICFLVGIVLFVQCGSPGCNPPTNNNVGSRSASVLGYSQANQLVLEKSTTTTPKTTTAAPSIVKPTSACANWYGNKGNCCFDCSLPYYISNGKNIPLCTCESEAIFRYTTDNCWPYASIDFLYFNNNTVVPNNRPLTYSVVSGSVNGMYVYETCVAYLNCTCKDPRTVPQPVIVFNPSPPVGPLATSTTIPDFNTMVSIVTNAGANGVIPLATEQVCINVLNSQQPFYYYNDAGDLPNTGTGEVVQLLYFSQNVTVIANIIFNDFTQTVARSTFYNQFMLYVTGELGRIYQFYQTAFTTYNTSLSNSESAFVSSTLSQVNNAIKNLWC
jgi:hypothetical protein